MQPVTFGMRLVLTYNLHFTDHPAVCLVYHKKDDYAMEENMRHVLARWTNKPKMFRYFLKNEYSDHSLHQNDPTDNDALRFNILHAACQSLGHEIFLGQVVISDWWEWEDKYEHVREQYWDWGRGPDDDLR